MSLMKYTLAEAMEDAAGWVSGATFNAESRGWRPAVALMREEIVRLRIENEKIGSGAASCAKNAEHFRKEHDEALAKYAQEVVVNLDACNRTAAAEAEADALRGDKARLIESIILARQCADGKEDGWREAVVKTLNAAVAGDAARKAGE